MKLVKPKMLSPGDKVATVSLSWGGAGDPELLWRYELGKRRLEEVYGLEVVEMPNTLKGTKYLYDHPEARAEDLMSAFADKSVRGIFSCIGGDDSIRLLPYIYFDVIKDNPKILLGYSDTTVAHFMCLKAGLSSIYGPSVLAEFAENIEIFEYTHNSFMRTLFDSRPIGQVFASPAWTGQHLKWTTENSKTAKAMQKSEEYDFLQGDGVVKGPLIGGCMEVLEMMKGTSLWPAREDFEGAILFFETSEDMPVPDLIRYWLRNYAAQGILQRAAGIIFGKPYQNRFYKEYRDEIARVAGEAGILCTPIVLNMSFGHNEPMACLPYGAMAKIDCGARTFSIVESGVI
ncbi:MAG TPA: LD-carboxypeptidase [Bacillota bacterium]|nr:LD-carboxypeptidase [Bacillota bacterium]